MRKTRGDLSWRDVGRWWDTEGCGNIGLIKKRGIIKGRIARVNIAQQEYGPLGKISEFLRKKNIHCKTYPKRTVNAYSLEIYRQDDVGRFLWGVEPYVLTEHHKDAINRLREFLNRPSRDKQRRR